jgi:excisionase family DNA binding protein
MTSQLQFHEAANIFPMEEESIDSLSQDIAANTQLVPIELCDGKILDGRRRYVACVKAGLTPAFAIVNPADPVQYVLSLNLHRRQLNPSQKSMVAARAREVYDRAAKERQRASGGDHKKKAVPANLPEPPRSDSRDVAGKAVGVGGRSVDFATKDLAREDRERAKKLRMAQSGKPRTAAARQVKPKAKQELGQAFLPPRPVDGLATVEEAAEFLRISPRQIYRLIAAKQLPVCLMEGIRGVRLPWESLHRFVKVEKGCLVKPIHARGKNCYAASITYIRVWKCRRLPRQPIVK